MRMQAIETGLDASLAYDLRDAVVGHSAPAVDTKPELREIASLLPGPPA
jgi:hypothetical protein